LVVGNAVALVAVAVLFLLLLALAIIFVAFAVTAAMADAVDCIVTAAIADPVDCIVTSADGAVLAAAGADTLMMLPLFQPTDITITYQLNVV
jgi:hypothetical protein